MRFFHGLFPKLSIWEWVTFVLIAAALSVTNIYTTLLTGWGDGGSIIAVLCSVLMLRLFLKREQITVKSLNLGQTLASAGGSVGFSVCAYAAVKMLQPTWSVSTWEMILLFIAMGILGTIIGSSVRNIMVHYFFPSGTACAVIQKTVTSEDSEAAKRPLLFLTIAGGIASLITIPTKLAAKKGGEAILSTLTFHKKYGIGLAMDPLLYGIGIVVGPRIGLGMLIGALASPFVIQATLTSYQFPKAVHGTWVKWMAIAILTVPTFATILFAYLFKVKTQNPEGFTPGATNYEKPKSLTFVTIVGLLVSTLVCVVLIQKMFMVPWYLTLLTIALSWPLCVMNGRVTGDTDINPVRLVAIVILSIFAFAVAGKDSALILLGMAIIGGTLAGMAVDMMQDLRTGYLVDDNPYHQTTVQIVGSIVGSLVAVPFILYLEKAIGFGEKASLKAPGAQIWSAMAKAFAGGTTFGTPLILAIVIVSIVFSLIAFLTVWPKTAPYIPSLFGIGIGLLLPFSMCAAIFAGGLLRWIVILLYKHFSKDKEGAEQQAGGDAMLIGSSIFAAGAIVSVLVVLANALLPKIIHLAH